MTSEQTTERPTVTLADGRVFGIFEGRKWTKVPRQMSNGQWTACYFVNEQTGEVRLAESWKSPKTWPLGQPHSLEALDIVARIRQN